jgi:glutamate carboxypeptidase
VHSFIKSRYKQFLQDLETIVNVDSGSGFAPGIGRVAAFFQERFERLGWHVRRLDLEAGTVPCLEVVNGRGRRDAGQFDFLFLGHMDTVFPEGTARRRPFSIHDGRAWGPGVCDMKAGLLTILHAAEAVQHTGVSDDLAVCIAFNSDEEVGSNGSRRWFEAIAEKSHRVLVFEPCRATGHRVLQRKGVADFEVLCHGRAAHAGVEPEKGANAVLELAHQILTVNNFSKPEEGTSVSVTTVSGGIAGNVIPDFAKAGFDIRISTVAEARRIEACFQNLTASGKVEGACVEVLGGINRMPMVPSDVTLRLWDRIAAIGDRLGLEMKLISTGGGSDGNFTAALGIPTIDAMGPQGSRAHSEEEDLLLDSVVPNTQLIVEIMKAAACGELP